MYIKKIRIFFFNLIYLSLEYFTVIMKENYFIYYYIILLIYNNIISIIV